MIQFLSGMARKRWRSLETMRRIYDASTKHRWISVSYKSARCSTFSLRSSISSLAKKSFIKQEHVADSRRACYPAVRTGSSNTRFFFFLRRRQDEVPFIFRGFFLVITCPRPPVFARPKKYSSCLSLHSQGLLSWVTVTCFRPPGRGGEQRRGLMPLGLFLFSIFWWSPAPDLRFSLSQTNTRRVFRYTS